LAIVTSISGFSRRDSFQLLAALMAAAMPASVLAARPRLGSPQPFSWELLAGKARALAARPYAAARMAGQKAADFDAAGKLTFGAAERLAGLVRLLPASSGAPNRVGIHIVEAGKARTLGALDGLFVGNSAAEPAGFRILAPRLETDWLAYQGASYFRAAGSRDQYGLSARGIAIDTGIDGKEEFPLFTDFWIERIADDHFIVHALLDGPSLSGAFAFDSRLGPNGVTQDVRAALFLRRDIDRLGIAPATSMFWYDEARRERPSDWRPEIHDSDGLAIWSGSGERIWRPLANPAAARVSSFSGDGLKGFGLMQRDQRFENYQDDGARYDRRPSLWIEPLGDWGPGAVLLYEMPTDSETLDNIVAFWVGSEPARAGGRRELRYRLCWTSDDLSDGGVAQVVNSWIGNGGIPGAPPVPGARKYVFDFKGAALAGLRRDSIVEAVVNLEPPTLLKATAYPVVGQQDLWRAVIDVMPAKSGVRDMRLYLRRGTAALSETVIEPLSG
jgi:glucans biosynthesis protein